MLTLLALALLALPVVFVLGWLTGRIDGRDESRQEYFADVQRYRRQEIKACKRMGVSYRINGRRGSMPSEVRIGRN